MGTTDDEDTNTKHKKQEYSTRPSNITFKEGSHSQQCANEANRDSSIRFETDMGTKRTAKVANKSSEMSSYSNSNSSAQRDSKTTNVSSGKLIKPAKDSQSTARATASSVYELASKKEKISSTRKVNITNNNEQPVARIESKDKVASKKTRSKDTDESSSEEEEEDSEEDDDSEETEKKTVQVKHQSQEEFFQPFETITIKQTPKDDEDARSISSVNSDMMRVPEERIVLSAASEQSPENKTSKLDATLFFRDGVRKTDYILVYRDSKDEKVLKSRRMFEENLTKQGLVLEVVDKQDSFDKKSSFVKIHAPWDTLITMAELMKIKMPINYEDESKNELEVRKTESGLFKAMDKKFNSPFALPEDLAELVEMKNEVYFTADFDRDKIDMFIIKSKDTFFSFAQRSYMVYNLLMRTKYDSFRDTLGIERLLDAGVYFAAYPLHDGEYTKEDDEEEEDYKPENDRQLLYHAWARPRRWQNTQPLNAVRHYFGEKIGIYFTWLGYYTGMLVPAAIVGVLVFMYGIVSFHTNVTSNEICDEKRAGGLIICPICDKICTYWKLSGNCFYSKITYLFDNEATVFFAMFMSVWATMFLEFWKRKQSEVRFEWDVADFDEEEHIRPEFEAKVKWRQTNPITKQEEPYLPLTSKIIRRSCSIAVVLFMVACVFGAVFGVIAYRVVVAASLYTYENRFVSKNAKLTANVSAAVISLGIIVILNKVYEIVAFFLTNLERCRTNTEYEDSFTFKMFIFQFINYYSSIFYIAFFKGNSGGHPGFYDYSLGFRAEECDTTGCFVELCLQLGVTMIGKQAINDVKEIAEAKLYSFKNAILSSNKKGKTRWEKDLLLADYPVLGLFEEYLEMVIQYGFITIFVAAFPLAPLFALINNLIEIRLDAYKFVTQWRRPLAERASDIGVWYGILNGITYIAVLVNGFIIAYTSDFIPKLVYVYSISPDRTLNGYVNWTLSVFAVKDFQRQSIPDSVPTELGNITHCRYTDFRHPPGHENEYEYSPIYWHVFAARFIFVLIFENLVFFIKFLVAYLIPDVPSSVKYMMLREKYLAKESKYKAEFSQGEKEKVKEPEPEFVTAASSHISTT